MESFATKGNLFAAALQSELFVVMMALSINARLPWKTHVAKIAQGLGAYSLLSVLIETGHSYFGVGRDTSVLILSHVRMVAYLVCVNYWIINLWRDERPARKMTRGNARKNVYIANNGGIRSSGLAVTEKVVNTHNFYFLVAIGIFVGALLFVAGYYYFRRRRASPANWEDLFAKLTWIDRNTIAEVALNLIDESGQAKLSDDAGTHGAGGNLEVAWWA